MVFWRDGWCSGVSRAMAAGLVALAAGCGGGDQVDPFVAGRVLAFGDETSVIEADGRKFTVNFLTAATATPPSTLDCTQHPLWVQTVAAQYGLSFPQCPGTRNASQSRILATPGALAVDVTAQVDAFLGQAGVGPFRGDDLVTMYAGANDVHALYAQVAGGTLTGAQAIEQATQAGASLARQVNRAALAGARVLIATLADQSFTPEGRSGLAPSGQADANKGQILHDLSVAFNRGLVGGELINDGRKIGLVQFDQNVNAVVNANTVNVTNPACNVADVRDCTTLTLRDGAAVASWFWADTLHLAPLGQSNLGSLAASRATNNPF